MEWVAYCSVCGELERAPNGPMMESVARLHRRDTGHMTIIGYEPSIVLSGKMVEVSVSKPTRPFPQTIAEWADLGDDIKRKDAELSRITNEKVGSIYYNIGDVDAAKRWLIEKSGELGIK